MKRIFYSACFLLVLLLATSISSPTRVSADIANGLIGPLHTEGKWIKDANGNTVKLVSVSWVGMGSGVPSQLWNKGVTIEGTMAAMKRAGFNSIRLPLSFDTYVTPGAPTWMNRNDLATNYPNLATATPIQVLDYFLDAANNAGLKVILDLHDNYHDRFDAQRPFSTSKFDDPSGNVINGLNDPRNTYSGKNNLADSVKWWELMAARYAQNPVVVGVDLFNEPHGEGDGWGTGDMNTDWKMQAQALGNAVDKYAPQWLKIVEGVGADNVGSLGGVVGNAWWGGNINKAGDQPVSLSNVVYSPHDYSASVWGNWWLSDATAMRELWEREWGYLARNNVVPIWIGEFGARNWSTTTTDGQQIHQLLDYMDEVGASFSYWTWFDGDSSDTGGLVLSGQSDPPADKITLLQKYMTVNPGFGDGTNKGMSEYTPAYKPFDPSSHIGYPPIPKIGGQPVAVVACGLIAPPPGNFSCDVAASPPPTAASPTPTSLPAPTTTPVPSAPSASPPAGSPPEQSTPPSTNACTSPGYATVFLGKVQDIADLIPIRADLIANPLEGVTNNAAALALGVASPRTCIQGPITNVKGRFYSSACGQINLQGIVIHGMEGTNVSPQHLWDTPWSVQLDLLKDNPYVNVVRLPVSVAAVLGVSVDRGSGTGTSQKLQLGTSALADLYEAGRDHGDKDLQAALAQGSFQMIQKVVDDLYQKGNVRVIFDIHRITPGDDTQSVDFKEQAPTADEKLIALASNKLAEQFANNPAVIGLEWYNEPQGNFDWFDLRAAGQRIGNDVLARAPNWMIFQQGDKYPTDEFKAKAVEKAGFKNDAKGIADFMKMVKQKYNVDTGWVFHDHSGLTADEDKQFLPWTNTGNWGGVGTWQSVFPLELTRNGHPAPEALAFTIHDYDESLTKCNATDLFAKDPQGSTLRMARALYGYLMEDGIAPVMLTEGSHYLEDPSMGTAGVLKPDTATSGLLHDAWVSDYLRKYGGGFTYWSYYENVGGPGFCGLGGDGKFTDTHFENVHGKSISPWFPVMVSEAMKKYNLGSNPSSDFLGGFINACGPFEPSPTPPLPTAAPTQSAAVSPTVPPPPATPTPPVNAACGGEYFCDPCPCAHGSCEQKCYKLSDKDNPQKTACLSQSCSNDADNLIFKQTCTPPDKPNYEYCTGTGAGKAGLTYASCSGNSVCSGVGTNGCMYCQTPILYHPPCSKMDDTGKCIEVNSALGRLELEPASLTQKAVSLGLGVSGGLLLLLIMKSGYEMMLSQGNPEKVKSARSTFTSALIGFGVIILGFVLYQMIVQDILHLPGFGK